MKIVSEEWKPPGSDEAIVILMSGHFIIGAFSHPYSRSVGDIVCEPLHIYSCLFIGRSTHTEVSIRRCGGSLEHELTAILRSRTEGIISVGDVLFYLEDDIPADIAEGELIDVICSRIDLW